MLQDKDKNTVEHEVKLLFAAFNKPQSYLDNAVAFLMEELRSDELTSFVDYVRKTRSRSIDFGGEKLECPRPVDLVSAIRTANRVNNISNQKQACSCHDGFVTIYTFQHTRLADFIHDNTVAKCKKCNGGKYAHEDPWFDRFIFGASGRWLPSFKIDHLQRWRDLLFAAIAAWDKQERYSGHPKVFIDWPQTRGDFVASLVKRGLWPSGLSYFDQNEQPELEELSEQEEIFSAEDRSRLLQQMDIGF